MAHKFTARTSRRKTRPGVVAKPLIDQLVTGSTASTNHEDFKSWLNERLCERGRLLAKDLSLNSSDVPSIMLKQRKDQLFRFSVFCCALSLDPKTEFLRIARETYEAVSNGNFCLGYMATFSRDDLPKIALAIEAVDKGDIAFPIPAKPVLSKKIRELEERYAKFVSVVSDKEVRLDITGGNYISLDKYFRVTKRLLGSNADFAYLRVPMINCKTILIFIKSRGALTANQSETDFRHATGVTFSAHDLFFSAARCLSHNGNTYIFSISTDSQEPRLRQLQPTLQSRAVSAGVSEQAAAAIMNCLVNLRGNSLLKTLENTFDFLRDKSSGEDTPNTLDESRLDFLMDRLNAQGKYPGTCKAISTMSVAFLSCLGFDARLIEGDLKGAGHVWAEFAIPGQEIWMPFDPAAGAFLKYPNEPGYYLQNPLPLSLLPFSIMVNTRIHVQIARFIDAILNSPD